jgi:hypothetical protein
MQQYQVLGILRNFSMTISPGKIASVSKTIRLEVYLDKIYLRKFGKFRLNKIHDILENHKRKSKAFLWNDLRGIMRSVTIKMLFRVG